MHIMHLRKVGGSVMLVVPPALLDILHLGAGVQVGLSVENGQLVVEPAPRPRYAVEELLAASNYSVPQPAEEREWVDVPAAGREEP